jgi:hypothetical protein
MNWGSLKIVIGRKVNDPTATKYAGSLLDNANAALRLLATVHTGLASVSDYTGDGETTQFPLPGNCVEDRIHGVYNVTNDTWLTRVSFFPGSPLDEGYYVWPNGYINFSPYIVDTYIYRLHYVAYFPELVDDLSVLYVPNWAVEAVTLYTAGRVLEDYASQMAVLSQFKTRVDSGNPEDQPILQLSKHYIEQFYELVNQHPVPQYGFL